MTLARAMAAVVAVAVMVGCVTCVGCSAPDQERPSAPRPDAGPFDAGHDARVEKDARPPPDATPDAARADVGGPTATTLSIAPLTLQPAFSTNVHDYYVQCGAGTNVLTVSMTAAPGSTIALVQPVTTPDSVDTTINVGVKENDAIVVGVKTSGTTDSYWVRCLPHDFPLLGMVQHPDAGTPTPGYYMLGDVIQAPGEGGYGMALDGNGVPIWYHTTRTGLGAVDVDSIIPGTISFVPNINITYASFDGQFELHDLVTRTTSLVQSVGMPLDMHDLRVMPNGDYLVFADPVVTGVDLTGLSTFGPEEDVVGCVIQEISPTGTLVWQWDIMDHFDAVEDSTWPQTDSVDAKTVIDAFHCNSIDIAPDGNLLVSARHFDSIFLVSRATGAVLWKMGGATYSKDGAPYIAVQNDPLGGFHRQHDVRLLPDGDISMFDDETDLPGPARAVVYSYDVTTGTASMVWQAQGTVSSLAMGSFRILADGSRVIGWGVGWGLTGAANRVFSEVDINGNSLLDFGFPDGDASYRAIKIPTATLDIDVMRATAGAD